MRRHDQISAVVSVATTIGLHVYLVCYYRQQIRRRLSAMLGSAPTITKLLRSLCGASEFQGSSKFAIGTPKFENGCTVLQAGLCPGDVIA